MYRFSGSSLANRHGVDGRLIAISDRALEITVIDFGIPKTGGLRTAETQRTLFEQGSSPLDGTNRRSKHQDGRALDFFAYVDGNATWQPEPMAMVAAAFLQAASELRIPVNWGGLWNSRDMPHIELVGA